MSFSDSVKNNVVVWLLGVLVGGFGAGFGAYDTILRVSDRTTISDDALIRLKNDLSETQAELADLLNSGKNSSIYSMPIKAKDLVKGDRWREKLACIGGDEELGINFDSTRPVEVSTFREGNWYITFENKWQPSVFVEIQLWCRKA